MATCQRQKHIVVMMFAVNRTSWLWISLHRCHDRCPAFGSKACVKNGVWLASAFVPSLSQSRPDKVDWVLKNIYIYKSLKILPLLIRHVCFIFCVYIYIVSCYICITFVNILLFFLFFFFFFLSLSLSLNVGNVGECCKAQWVCVHQRIALYKSYLLFLFSLLKTNIRIITVYIFTKYFYMIMKYKYHYSVTITTLW